MTKTPYTMMVLSNDMRMHESVEVYIEEARLVGLGTKEICRATINSTS